MFLIVFLLSAVTNHISPLGFIEQPPLNCSQKELLCSVHLSRANCSDEGWVRERSEAPGFPAKVSYEELSNAGVPELSLTLTQPADDGIYVLNGTEVQVLEVDTNSSLCVRYIFGHPLPGNFNPHHQPWTFVFNQIVVDPGLRYQVFVSNLPKPKVGPRSIVRNITVPGCKDDKFQKSKVCLENGSLWHPNLTWSVLKNGESHAVISMTFNTGEFSDKYRVGIRHPNFSSDLSVTVLKDNRTSISVNLTLDTWQFKRCDFEFVIKPYFLRCMNDCSEYRKKFTICQNTFIPSNRQQMIWVALGLTMLFLCGVIAVLLHRKSHGDTHSSTHATNDSSNPESIPAQEPSKILIIYSLDHPLYKEIVLKLCAFLRVKCGADVTLDLLESTSLSTVGRIQWLDMQREKLSRSTDKVLILCSPGVYVKWRAMCGGKRVVTREDARSPMGDMLTPALSLIMPDFVYASSFQKYVVAYFEGVCGEKDVPAPFNVAVKYSLMRHFEELFFRLLDTEKHEPGRINLVEGIGGDDYHKCPSGSALKSAIEEFQAYQLANQNWFEMELVDAEEEVEENNHKKDWDGNIYWEIFQHELQNTRPTDSVFISQLNDEISTVPSTLILCDQISQTERKAKETSDKP